MPVEIKKLFAVHLDLVPRLFEFLEQAESHDFGGEGSGNWGHGGRPGEVGGSGEGGGSLKDSVLKRVESALTKELGHAPSKELLNERANRELKEASKIEAPKVESPEKVPYGFEPVETPKGGKSLSDIVNEDTKPEEERLLSKGVEEIKKQNKYETLDAAGKEKVDSFLKENRPLIEKAVKEVVSNRQGAKVKYARSVDAAIKERTGLLEKAKTTKLGWKEEEKVRSLGSVIKRGYEVEDWVLGLVE